MAERLAISLVTVLRHPWWFAGAARTVLTSRQPTLLRSLRLLPNVAVAAGVVERARRSGRSTVLDQGPWQFAVSTATAGCVADLSVLVPPWARPDVVVVIDPGRSEVVSRLRQRIGRSRADRLDDPTAFLDSFDAALARVETDATVSSVEEAFQFVDGTLDEAAMHVCHVITWLDRGGAQQNTLLSVEGQRRRGNRVTVVHGTKHGAAGPLVERVGACGAERIEVSMLRQEIDGVRDLLATIALWRTLRRVAPDVVHTHSSKAGIFGRFAARLARVPAIVHTAHGWSFHDQQRPAERRVAIVLERLAWRCTDALVILAESDRRKGRDGRIGDADRYHLIRSGVDLDPFRRAATDRAHHRASLCAELGIDPVTVLIGSVTRLSEQKDPRTLLAAVASLREIHPKRPIAVVIVGDGPLEAETVALRRELGLDHVVHLLGSRDDVPELVAGFDLFVLTSRWEGLPRVVPEAMAAGTPVVATDVDGTSEILEPEVTGLLVQPQDPDGIAAALGRLLDAPDLATAMAATATTVVDDWDAPRMVQALEDLYRELLGLVSD